MLRLPVSYLKAARDFRDHYRGVAHGMALMQRQANFEGLATVCRVADNGHVFPNGRNKIPSDGCDHVVFLYQRKGLRQ